MAEVSRLEREFTKNVMTECHDLGLLVHHCPDSRRCEGDRGMPDIIVASERGLLVAELKMDGNDTSADQDRWIYTLHQAGIPCMVWRPDDWHAIKAKLRALA